MYKLTILLLTIFEARITYMAFYLESLKFSYFLILHSLVVLVLFFYYQYKKKDASIYNGLTVAIPFAGIFLYLMNIIFLKEKDFNIVEEVFDFEKYLDEKFFLKDINLREELKLISAIDTMSVEGEKEKKEFITKFKPQDIKIKVKILRKGLVDKDIEVVHYSAVEFNQLSEKFDKQLRAYKIKYKKSKEEKDFDDLIIFYENYLKNDILVGEILNIHREMYIDILEKRIEVDKRLKNYIRLLNMYLVTKKYDKVEKECKKLLLARESNFEIYIILTKLYYESKNLKGLKEINQRYKEEEITMTEEVQNIFEICGIKG
ncbi:hypothetical protein [Psychrilyobacter sp.]|uniref:hypothetical protein n=1 Tax=Psychrilyobacter sp. TaxID=2586924 RepID=UPI00301ACE81